MGLNACAESGRWYTADQVELGEEIYRSNCLVCHKESGMATEDWKKKDVDGKFPPPPLNGTAHTWHHDLGILRKTVLEGGVKLGGSMPGFKGVLS
ncbi:MAG: cytochrome c, partial [Phycisphaerae bacterium]|nr:cytochrome c [Phycisphaerae bacterium]NIP54025.1 cytochrome c [Phycisphaerae bacterium]NIU10436.1 cytochrome c [Phycisphaerae bacterium]NIX27360.1 cytochrome c [Phycisphaerae bacterium]